MNIFMYAQEGIEDEMLDTLIGEDASTFSVRENSLIEKAMEFGEVWSATWDPNTFTMTTDLCNPESIIAIAFPKDTDVKIACKAMRRAIGELL